MNIDFLIPKGDRATHFVQWWSRVQERGKVSYVVRRAIWFAPGFIVLFVGLQVAYDIVIRSMSFRHALSRWDDFSLPTLLVWLIGLSMGGILTGWLEWRRNQWLYHILRNQQHNV